MKYPNIISASAGSGKTYTITQKIYEQIENGVVTPDKIIATTFTIKAANELKGRIREKLISGGKIKEANLMNEALIGTINSVCLKLLRKFAFEAGLSPDLKTLDENDQKVLMRELIGSVLDDEFIELAVKLEQGESKNPYFPGTAYLKQIEAIILKTRVNDLSKEDLEKCGEDSVQEFFDLFPQTTRDHDHIRSRVITHLEQGIKHAQPLEHNPTSYKALAKLQTILQNLKSDNHKWSEWIGLKKKILADKYLPKDFTKELDEVIGDLTADLSFRADYTKYIKSCFAYAREVIDAYEDYKKRRGLLDFADQEAIFYRLLKQNEKVKNFLSENYQLVVVDEFQDVSPLQLDIFLKLTQLIDQNIWVGDPKQSIFAFRGADPQLMQSVLSAVPKKNRQQLDRSYRSRKALVHFTNAVFSKTFEETMEAETITLEQADPIDTGRNADEEKHLATAVHYWHFHKNEKKPTIADALKAMAEKVQSLLEEDIQVFDKNTKTYRPVSYGDIAILCRSNKKCQEAGEALTAVGLPVATSGFGLIKEPEIIFLSALLKLLAFPGDRLAKAEVLLYSRFNGDQEALLNDRVLAEDSYKWQADDALLLQLQALKPQLYNLPPARCIATLMTALELEKLFVSWGNLNQRLANVDAFISHAQEYQLTCHSMQTASTIAGLLNWMQQLHRTDEDYKGVQSGNVIQVMTYHKSKGLEWGIVLLWDLGMEPWNRFFGVKVKSPATVRLDDPLADRALRLFVKPFNPRSKFESFDEPIARSAAGQAGDTERDAEEQRLFYVAMTRARDYLIFCSLNKKMTIPELVHPALPQPNSIEGLQDSTFSWQKKALPIRVQSTDTEDSKETTRTLSTNRTYFAPPSGRQEHQPLRIRPSSAEKVPSATIKGTDLLHNRAELSRKHSEITALGIFIHNLYCAYDERLDETATHSWVTQQVQQSAYADILDPAWLSQALQSFHNYLSATYVDYKLHKELPIQAITPEGQYLEGYVDLVVEVGGVLLIIDYKTFVTKDYQAAEYEKKALSFSGQLGLYKEVLERSFGKRVDGAFVYFVFEGRVMEVG